MAATLNCDNKITVSGNFNRSSNTGGTPLCFCMGSLCFGFNCVRWNKCDLLLLYKIFWLGLPETHFFNLIMLFPCELIYLIDEMWIIFVLTIYRNYYSTTFWWSVWKSGIENILNKLSLNVISQLCFEWIELYFTQFI